MIYSIITLCLERHHFQFDVVHLHHAHDIMEPKDAIYDNQAPQPQRNNDKKKKPKLSVHFTTIAEKKSWTWRNHAWLSTMMWLCRSLQHDDGRKMFSMPMFTHTGTHAAPHTWISTIPICICLHKEDQSHSPHSTQPSSSCCKCLVSYGGSVR